MQRYRGPRRVIFIGIYASASWARLRRAGAAGDHWNYPRRGSDAKMLGYVGGIYRCLSLVSFSSRLDFTRVLRSSSNLLRIWSCSPRFYTVLLSVLGPAPVVIVIRPRFLPCTTLCSYRVVFYDFPSFWPDNRTFVISFDFVSTWSIRWVYSFFCVDNAVCFLSYEICGFAFSTATTARKFSLIRVNLYLDPFSPIIYFFTHLSFERSRRSLSCWYFAR